MTDKTPGLSKSKLMSSRQCLKRLHLELHHSELAEESATQQAIFDMGHQVGDKAIEIYGGGAGTKIEYEKGLAKALEQTLELMQQSPPEPIFEATFEHDGVVVRVDVLLPQDDGWKIIEVKSSTKVKAPHRWDCAIQAWVFQNAGYALTGIALAHVDNSFVYPGGGDYRGLLKEKDLTALVEELLPQVPETVAAARKAASKTEPDIGVGGQCTSPYQCPFQNRCWPTDTAYPIQGLGGSRKFLGELVADGYRDVTEVPVARLTNDKQAWIQRVTSAGEYELLPGAYAFVRDLAYPRYYLDFETIGPAIPIWPGTRPFKALPVQWSCHIEERPGELRHEEFLDLTEVPPMRKLAEAMVRTLGKRGPILMYTRYERDVIRGLAELFPDLADEMRALEDRLVDLAVAVQKNYYHPAMSGSWSIKAVIPTIDKEMNYERLEGINEGYAASVGYLTAIDPATDPARRRELEKQLRDYCRIDTEAMVRIVLFFEASESEDKVVIGSAGVA